MNSENPEFRKYGSPPYRLVLVHGGPGAAGTLAPLAGKLSPFTGILEALQTENCIDALILELFHVITWHSDYPVLLFGHSWGAWLSLIFAARHPDLVYKLVLAGSAPLEEKYMPGITETRLSRLNEKEKARLPELMARLERAGPEDQDMVFSEIGRLLKKADAYDTATDQEEEPLPDYALFRSVWQEAGNLRNSGGLLRIIAGVQCPVLVIHGDHDPHPADGIRIPLKRTIGKVDFILLEKCGHEPWKEKHASERFYRIMQTEIREFSD